jgi:hypothetical protein
VSDLLLSGSDLGFLSLLVLFVRVTSVKGVDPGLGVLRVDLGEPNISSTNGDVFSDAGKGVVTWDRDPCDHAVGLGWVMTA